MPFWSRSQTWCARFVAGYTRALEWLGNRYGGGGGGGYCAGFFPETNPELITASVARYKDAR